MANRGRVLIAGGGIAGLTGAAALHRRGIAVDLIERNAHWDAPGAGIAVQPNGIRVLRELGLGPAVERAGAKIRRWRFRDQHGDVLCDVDLEALWGDRDPFIGIARVDLQKALVSGAAATRCRLGTCIHRLARSDRSVSVDLSDGSREEYALIIGADGIDSNVRRL